MNNFRRLLLVGILAFAVLPAAAVSSFSDTIKLRNGDILKCKVVKEMQNMVKVRMARKGKIVTTFLNRGTIASIQRASDAENRLLFKKGGVANPSRSFEPVYYSGSAPPPSAGKGRPGTARGKAGGNITRERGVEARRKRSEERAKERERSKRGESSRTGSPASTGSAPATAPLAPSTSGGAGTTSGTSVSR